MRYIKLFTLFIIGGLLYYCIELLYRGYSTWQMFFAGGVCFVLIGLINELFSWTMPLWIQGIIAALMVTIVEYVSGLVLNVWLKLNIWDYSNMPFNLQGQICLYFSLLWFVLGIGAIILDDWLRYWLFDEERPRYRII